MAEPPHILFIDDQVDETRRFLSNMEGLELEQFTLKVVDPRMRDELAAALTDPAVQVAFIDRIIQGSGTCLASIEHVLRDRPNMALPAYIVSGVDAPTESAAETLRKWREKLGHWLDVRGALSKPLASADLLGAIASLKQRPNGGIPSPDRMQLLQSFQLPARIVSRGEGVQYFKNSSWIWHENQPPFQSNDEGTEFFEAWAPPGADPASPRQRNLTAFRVVTSQFSQNADLQIAVPFEASPADSVDAHLENIWRLLQITGFTRMRYYRRRKAPGSGGILSLHRWFGTPELNVETFKDLSWRKQEGEHTILYSRLDGVLATRFNGYDRPTRPAKFVFKNYRVTSLDPAIQDPTYAYWNAVSDLEAGAPCLEFPILCRTKGRGADTSYEARAIIVADTSGSGPAVAIEDEQVERRAPSLRSHCIELGRLLEEDYDRERSESRERARTFVINNPPQSNDAAAFDRFSRALADEARLITGADITIVCFKAQTSKSGVVNAISLDDRAQAAYPHANRLLHRFVTERNLPILNLAIAEGVAQFAQDGLEQAPPNAEIPFRAPRIAIPLKVGGRVVGAIGLADRRPRRFTQRRVDAVADLADLAALAVEFLSDAASARLWETTLLHEVTSQTLSARKALAESMTDQDDPQLDRAAWRMDLLLAAAAGLRGLRGASNIPPSSKFDPRLFLADDLKRAARLGEDFSRPKTFQVQRTNCPPVAIEASQQIFGYVVRTLLDNAMRHGTSSQIKVAQELADGAWRLTVENTGHMSPDEFLYRFEPFIGRGTARAGTQTGLAAAKKWTEHFGAALSVANACGKHDGECGCKPRSRSVIAKLTWPLAGE